MFLAEAVALSVVLRWLDHGNYFEWQQYYIHQYHDSKAVNNCIGHETVDSGNKLNHNLNQIKFENIEHWFEILHNRCDHP